MIKDLNKICNQKVFENIFNRYAKDLKRFLYIKTQDMDLAEDILQDTFVKLWEHCDNVNYNKVRSYLYTVAKNLFLNVKKHEKVVRKSQNLNVKESTIESPEYLMLEQEFLIKIENAISELPKNQKKVFLLNRMEQKKYREIAGMLDISIKTVEKRMHLALKSMKEKIGNV